MRHDQTPSVLSNLPQAGSTGFAELAPMAAAWAWLDGLPAAAAAETLSLDAARGRILAEDTALDAAPPGRLRAAANGYAVLAASCIGASAYNPLLLTLLPPGTDPLPNAASCPVTCGWTLPAGADAVLPPEAAQSDGEQWLEVLDAVPRGTGLQTPSPALHLPAGHCLRPQDLGCLAAAGVGTIAVLRRPRVALLVPGPKSGPDVLTSMLRALLARDGAATVVLPFTAAVLTDPAIEACDLVLLAGRAGVGIDDIAATQVRAAGGSMALHGLALRPSGSVGLASLPRGDGTVPLLLLPGDPLGCLIAYDLLAARLLRRFAGITPASPYPVADFSLARKIVSGLGSTDVIPVRLEGGEVEQVAADAGLAGASSADGFVLVPESSEGYPAGAPVSVHLYAPTTQGSMP